MAARSALLAGTGTGWTLANSLLAVMIDFILVNPEFSLISDTGMSTTATRAIIIQCGTSQHYLKFYTSETSIFIATMDIANSSALGTKESTVALINATWFYAYEGTYNFLCRSTGYAGTFASYTITDDSRYWLDNTYEPTSDTTATLEMPYFTKKVVDGALLTIQPRLHMAGTYVVGACQELYAVPTTIDGFVYPNVITDGTNQYLVLQANLIFKLS